MRCPRCATEASPTDALCLECGEHLLRAALTTTAPAPIEAPTTLVAPAPAPDALHAAGLEQLAAYLDGVEAARTGPSPEPSPPAEVAVATMVASVAEPPAVTDLPAAAVAARPRRRQGDDDEKERCPGCGVPQPRSATTCRSCGARRRAIY
jgi:hypothetical protein